jgi:hypothetical protein
LDKMRLRIWGRTFESFRARQQKRDFSVGAPVSGGENPVPGGKPRIGLRGSPVTPALSYSVRTQCLLDSLPHQLEEDVMARGEQRSNREKKKPKKEKIKTVVAAPSQKGAAASWQPNLGSDKKK